MTKKNILIKGGTAAIGSSLAKQIKNLHYNPILIARDKVNLEKISKQLNCKYFECDVLDSEMLKTIINNFYLYISFDYRHHKKRKSKYKKITH